MKIKDMVAALQRIAADHPDAEVMAHWEGWVLTPLTERDFWLADGGQVVIDCNDQLEKLEGDETAICGGLRVRRLGVA